MSEQASGANTNIESVADWQRDHGYPLYGNDADGEFTGWVMNPDTGLAVNVFTEEKTRVNLPEECLD